MNVKKSTLFNKILDQHFEEMFQKLFIFIVRSVNTLKEVSGLFKY